MIILLLAMVYISGCTNNETKSGQFDNNNSGIDRDHTAAPPDTVAINESAIEDTIQTMEREPVDNDTSKQ